MVTLTQRAASTAPCQFSVSVIDDTGAPVDPTGNPVEVSYFPVTSPPAEFDPDTATWYAATWSVQPGNPPTYFVNFMPGPLNGGAPIPAGAYVVIGQVTSTPAVPLLDGCYLILT